MKILRLYFIFIKEISVIYEDEKKKLDLDEYTKKLVMSKKRLNTVQATVIAVQVIFEIFSYLNLLKF